MSAVIKTMMKTPLRRVVGKKAIILHVVGRKTGKVYDVVVFQHHIDGRLVLSVARTWGVNLRGGAELDVTTAKGVQRGRITLDTDSRAIAEVFTELIRQVGFKKANFLALKVNVDRLPTVDEVEPAINDRWAGYLDFLD